MLELESMDLKLSNGVLRSSIRQNLAPGAPRKVCTVKVMHLDENVKNSRNFKANEKCELLSYKDV